MKVIKPPQQLEIQSPSIFLAGSIEMGKAVDWQTELTNSLSDLPVTILNPRRDDWDSSWEQKITNPQFREQVEWELDGLRQANLVVVYFDPKTTSPITMMELGLMVGTPMKQVIVCCPEGFYRKGNVDIVCKKYKIEQAKDLADLKSRVRERVERWS